MTTPADRATAIDPVAEPDAYRREILSWLGDDDPAAVQAATTAALRAIVRDAGDQLRVRPEPREWSVIECVGHLVDAELVVATRVRWILAEDEPDIVGYDQDRWVETLRHREADPGQLIAFFDAVRSSNLRLWAATSIAARDRFGRHRERGPESYEMTVRLAAGHDRFHLAQAARALAAVRGG